MAAAALTVCMPSKQAPSHDQGSARGHDASNDVNALVKSFSDSSSQLLGLGKPSWASRRPRGRPGRPSAAAGATAESAAAATSTSRARLPVIALCRDAGWNASAAAGGRPGCGLGCEQPLPQLSGS